MSKFFHEFLQFYRLILLKIIQVKGINEIHIKDFDFITRNCCPVSKELFFLFGKVLLTSFLLVILYLTLNELNFLHNEDSVDLNSLLLYVFILLTPGLLEILFFENNVDKVERMHNDIDEHVKILDNLYELERNIPQNPDQSTNTTNYSNMECKYKQLMLLIVTRKEMFGCRFIHQCCCGCLDCHCGENGYCKCCYTYEEVADEDGKQLHIIKPFCLCHSHNEVDNISMNDIEMT
jgi:hypothetical protein